MKYTVTYTTTARKELAKIARGDKTVANRIAAAVNALASDPRPSGVVDLTDRPGYRIRVGGYRVIYTVNDTTVTVQVFRVSKRGGAY